MACLLAWGCGGPRQVMSVPLVPPLIAPPQLSIFWMEPFHELSPSRWRDVEVRGKSQYQVVTLDGRSCLKAESHGGASILLASVRFDPQVYPWLAWEWRVDQLIEREALDTPKGSDAPARVYVYFETQGLPWQKRNVDYVWSAFLPVGARLTSAYSAASHILVVESGAAHLGRWRRVERNVADDYRQSFHEDPPPVIAIGLMTDSDNTGGDSLAYIDDIRIGRFSSAEPSR